MSAVPTSELQEQAPILVAFSPGSAILVVGPRAGGGHQLGNVSRQVADRAACPILTLPRSAAGSDSLLAHAEAHLAL